MQEAVPSRLSLRHPLSDLQAALCPPPPPPPPPPPEGASSKLVPRLIFRLQAKETPGYHAPPGA